MSDRPVLPGRLRRAAPAVACVVGLLAGATACSGDHPPAGAAPARAADVVDHSDADLWLDFEDEALDYDGGSEYPDANGSAFTAKVVTAGDGEVDQVEGGDGSAHAVAFPTLCADESGCPRAMLEVAPDPALDPGAREFAFGASVRLPADQTTTGSNVVQRGRFGSDGGLWKLQVDDAEGFPSCVVRSGEDLVTVRSSVSVADDAWHRIECRRDATGVSIDVDGAVDREAGATGSVSTEYPLRIGSPGVGEGDDQFHGRVDDVFLLIGPPV